MKNNYINLGSGPFEESARKKTGKTIDSTQEDWRLFLNFIKNGSTFKKLLHFIGCVRRFSAKFKGVKYF